MQDFLYGYTSSAVFEIGDRFSPSSFIDGKELKLRGLNKARSMTLSEIEKFCLEEFPRTAGWDLRVKFSQF